MTGCGVELPEPQCEVQFVCFVSLEVARLYSVDL